MPSAGAPGSSPVGTPPTKKKGWIWALVGCGVCGLLSLIALVLLLVGLGAFTSDGGEERATSAPETSEPASSSPEEESSSAPASSDPASSSSAPAAAPAGEVLPAGSEVTVEDMQGEKTTVQFGTVNWDATDEVMNAPGNNPEPPAGTVYVVVPATVTYQGGSQDTAIAALRVSASLQTADGSSASATDVEAFVEHSAFSEPIPAGTPTEVNWVFAVPSDQAGKGTMEVQSLTNFNAEPVTVALR
ncbi:hypothetical protein JSY14_06800 [Brachybacterium sp. EF45031]|uniref:hypothetical protein n=1 Tax=Brachybacterium sillae TaxID=2810536 RepID=UPI00217D6CE0|nr:hypothetical protein [Brachybacterium sillae]MCS6711742.1 hypothetical protein [Brachybacterium sillae]